MGLVPPLMRVLGVLAQRNAGEKLICYG